MDNFIDDNEQDDLFGDESGAEQVRQLDDSELDSGDDLQRHDRDPEDVVMEESRDVRVLDSELSRHPIPQATDGEIRTLRIPKFLGIAARPYDADDFRVPTTDHHSDSASANFSAYATAMSTMRYRKNGDQLESNTLVHRWSDGSITLQVGDQHYELQHKSLVPPKDAKYQDILDAHQYLATPQLSSQLMQLIGHMTSQYIVTPNKELEDDALEKLQSSLAAAARGRKDDAKDGVMITSNEDPELQKKRAEMAEKERLKAQRRRETASARADAHVRYRSSGFGAGLSIDDLEGARSSGATRKRAPGPKRTSRRHDYSSEEEYERGRGGQNEYDLEDDFVAASDEEGTPEPDDDEEEILDDSDSDDRRRHKKRRQESDEDAEGEVDEDATRPSAEVQSGRGRRNIIEDDDDE